MEACVHVWGSLPYRSSDVTTAMLILAGAMPRVFIGRTHDLYGKSLWELLCNLKDFGAGRVVKRTKFNRRYPEASWYRIISAQPEMDEVSAHCTQADQLED